MKKLLSLLKAHALQGVLVLALLALGGFALQRAIRLRKPPVRHVSPPAPHAVRVVEAKRVALRPWAHGYGVVAPQTTWRAVNELNARVIKVHPRLRDGALIEQGEILVELDRTELQLVLEQTEAQIGQLQAQRKRLAIQQANDQARLEIEKRALTLAKTELTRQQELLKQKTVAQVAVDAAEGPVLTARSKVVGLEASLALLPAQEEELKASIALQQARRRQTELDLKKATVRAQFDGRATQVQVEEGQFVRMGEVLLALEGTAVAEVSARISVEKLRALMQVIDQVEGSAPQLGLADRLALRRKGFEVRVRLRIEPEVYEWPATFDRAEGGLDPKTRTLGMVVTVKDPYAGGKRGPQPPLAKGMFVEVILRTSRSADVLIVPRSAVHQGTVRTVGADGTLEIVPVSVDFLLDRLAVLRTGPAPGTRVLVSDIVPAINGTRITPEDDVSLARSLERLITVGPDAAGAK